jgi:hypothetical protein
MQEKQALSKGKIESRAKNQEKAGGEKTQLAY